VPIASADSFVIDFYGREDQASSTWPRDNDFDVWLRDGGFSGTIVASLTGLGIPDSTPLHTRATFSSLSSQFDTIEIVGHDTWPSAAANYFTLMEVRAAGDNVQLVPEPGTFLMLGMGLLGLSIWIWRTRK
jgi:hypothetical protein